MEQQEIRAMLEQVAKGEMNVDDAMLQLKKAPYEDLGFAKIDTHRALRQGAAEVIYGAGKTARQIAEIASAMYERGQNTILITRMDQEKADVVAETLPLRYDAMSRVGIVGEMPPITGNGTIVVATGGTSDVPVAEEAALTAEALVGVAGLHRLLSHLDEIMNARVIVAIAGMEGALASVIGGLADCPVIAVPTSVGYGANFGGLSALLSMLNSCASGTSVVNIDNGFGAGYLASMIAHIGGEK